MHIQFRRFCVLNYHCSAPAAAAAFKRELTLRLESINVLWNNKFINMCTMHLWFSTFFTSIFVDICCCEIQKHFIFASLLSRLFACLLSFLVPISPHPTTAIFHRLVHFLRNKHVLCVNVILIAIHFYNIFQFSKPILCWQISLCVCPSIVCGYQKKVAFLLLEKTRSHTNQQTNINFRLKHCNAHNMLNSK